MNRIFTSVSLLLLAACTQASVEVPDTPKSPAASTPAGPVEAYPSELSVEHFSNMTLSGSDLTLGRVLEQNSVYIRHYITYRSNGVKVSGTLAIPNAEGTHPLIVLNHGFIDPAVYTNGRGLRREQDALARAGFAVLHTDYRGHAESDEVDPSYTLYDNALAYAMDSANAVLAVRAANLPNVNAEKVGMLGHSMGGGVTLQILVARPELIDAAVLYAPINADAWANFDRWRIDSAEGEATLADLGTKEQNPARWAAMSQSGYLQNIDDPILLFQGLKDTDVPAAWSSDLAVRLESLDKESRYITYPEDGHEFAKTWQHFINTSIEFYKKNLGEGEN